MTCRSQPFRSTMCLGRYTATPQERPWNITGTSPAATWDADPPVRVFPLGAQKATVMHGGLSRLHDQDYCISWLEGQKTTISYHFDPRHIQHLLLF